LDATQTDLPDRFHVVVIMQRSALDNPWVDYRWEAVGVAVDSEWEAGDRSPRLAHDSGDQLQALHHGFRIQLQVDECESYYHNLVSPQPRCYVVATPDEQGDPVPRIVSLSFDEAHAYLEGEEEVFVVDMPPELYRWTEAFVLDHYVPSRRTKRKLRNWSEEQGCPS